jgi:hypothetical protein
MRAELLAELCAIARGEHAAKSPGTPVTPVTLQLGYRPKRAELQALRRLQAKGGNEGKRNSSPVTAPATAAPEPDEVAIEERAGLASDCVPSVYLDAWARLNCRKPASVSEAEWRLALDDGGWFLDAWGGEAAEVGWTPSELFAARAGLAWRLAGERVEAIGRHSARLSDGRTFARHTPAVKGT